jgi:hypothetical protein
MIFLIFYLKVVMQNFGTLFGFTTLFLFSVVLDAELAFFFVMEVLFMLEGYINGTLDTDLVYEVFCLYVKWLYVYIESVSESEAQTVPRKLYENFSFVEAINFDRYLILTLKIF